MNHDSKRMSRRDWFRLRQPRTNKTLGEPGTNSGGQAALVPIELPPNHDGMDLDLLPPMREATISSDQLSDLFADIGQLASDVLLMQRTSGSRQAQGRAPNGAADMQRALKELLNGSIQRVQIRYRWNDGLWIDTLKRESTGYHLVRIAHANR